MNPSCVMIGPTKDDETIVQKEEEENNGMGDHLLDVLKGMAQAGSGHDLRYS